MIVDNLIFDLGVADGFDSRFYLDKGFKVIGIEANPIACAHLRKTFFKEIEAGMYQLLESGVWSESTMLPFYINLENDHWSSFDPNYGCRNNTRFDVIDIPCTTVHHLFQSFGIPRYLKIDVEGADKLILNDLSKSNILPTFISVEEYGVQCIDDLMNIGYKEFAIVPQSNKKMYSPPFPSREGNYVEKSFHGRDSGLFGDDLPGPWMSYREARELFLGAVRKENYEFVGPAGEWFDVHARCKN